MIYISNISSNKTHNKNIKNIHAPGTFTNPGIHTPPSYVALSRDARTAYASTRYYIAYHSYPWQYSRNIYCKYPAVQDLMYRTPM